MLDRFLLERKSMAPRAGGYQRGATSRYARRHILPVLLLLGLSVTAQAPATPAAVAGQVGLTVQRDMDSSGAAGIDARMQARRLAVLNQQRQHEMVADAEKLLKLARELNADADAGGTILSEPERLQKTAEIQKLAKSVKDKMTFAIGAAPDIRGPFTAWQR